VIVFPHELFPQGKQEWLRLRLGRPTASEFGSILTPAQGKPSAARKPFAARHVDERVSGGPVDVKDGYMTKDMERGVMREHEACMIFERETGLFTRKVGFVATDDGRFGCSPDRLVCPDEESPPFTGLEVKNYNAVDHFAWQEEGTLPNDFKCQVHGCMIVTGFRSWWWMNHCPPYEPVIIEVHWDAFTNKLAAALEEFDRDVFRPMLARVCENAVLRGRAVRPGLRNHAGESEDAMNHTCWLSQPLTAKDGEITYSRFVELPCPPFVGLVITFNEKELDCAVVSRVEYSVEHETFWLECETIAHGEGCNCLREAKCCTLKPDEMMETGWAIESGPYFGFDRIRARLSTDGWRLDPWVFDPEVNYFNRPKKEPLSPDQD